MHEVAKAELLRALGGLVRGLSILFWGLGLTGLVCLGLVYLETAQTFWRETFTALAFMPALVPGPLIWHGLRRFARFSGAGADLAARLEPGGDARGAGRGPGAIFILVA